MDTAHVAVNDPHRAVMTAEPTETAVMIPDAFTVAFVEFEVHVTVLLVAFDGRTVATSVSVFPGCIVVVVRSNEILVAATATVMVHVAVRLLPSVLVAKILAVPAATAVIKPDEFTVAIAVLLDDHVSVLLVAFDGTNAVDI